MSVANLLKACIPQSIKNPLKQFMGVKSMESRLLNLKKAGFKCTGAVDIGAFHGEWSKSLREIWQVPLILVEPQEACKAVLEKFAREHHQVAAYLEFCAVGKEMGTAKFYLEETNSRIAKSDDEQQGTFIHVPVKTLKQILLNRHGNFNLLKADVQGFELEVLEGADDMLQQFEVIILEVSIIRIGSVPTFYEVMQYMDSKGYRLYDFLPMYYRPLDNALWQGDAFFVRNDSPLVSSLQWS